MNPNQKINITVTFTELMRLWDLCNALGDPEPLYSIIHRKIDAMEKHELYSQSKTAQTEDEREKARQEYLDRVGMDSDFRWAKGKQG